MSDNRPVVIEKPLSTRETMQLEKLEGVIKRDLAAFYRVGMALMTINNERLYRTTEGRTFEQYCKETWDVSKRQAYRLMDGALVYENLNNILCPNGTLFEDAENSLSTIGGQTTLPLNERQIRPLVKFKNNPQQLANVWKTASRLAKNSNKKPTAAIVKRVVKDYLGENIEKAVRKAKEAAPDQVNDVFMAAFNSFADQITAARKGGYKEVSRDYIIRTLDQLRSEIAVDGEFVEDPVVYGGSNDWNKLEKAGFKLFRMDRASMTIRKRSEAGGWKKASGPYTTVKSMEAAFKELLLDDMHLRG